MIDRTDDVELHDPEGHSPVVGSSKPRLLRFLGPGLITGASDDDPSGIATYSQAGAQFGYALSWTLLFTYPLMAAVQIISARMGRTTGRGIAGVLRAHAPNWLMIAVVLLLLAANVINIGADLGAMADATRMLLGGPHWLWVAGFAVLSALLQVFMQYTRYVAVLKWLALVLLVYVVTVFMAHVEWGRAASSMVVPRIQWSREYLTTIVALFGTTISPYLFFWQASQEAEDIRVYPERQILKRAPDQAEGAIRRIQADTLVGMGVSNVIALAIMLTTAATLHKTGVTIESSAQAAEALKPTMGAMAQAVFALGVIGTGLLAVPVLAGSAAYAIGEALKWPTGLDRGPLEAKAFYATIVIATLVGMLLNFTTVNPIAALYWSAVVNGVTAVPVMALMMVLASSEKVMGAFKIGPWLRILGWFATLAMAASVLVMAGSAVLG